MSELSMHSMIQDSDQLREIDTALQSELELHRECVDKMKQLTLESTVMGDTLLTGLSKKLRDQVTHLEEQLECKDREIACYSSGSAACRSRAGVSRLGGGRRRAWHSGSCLVYPEREEPNV